MNRLQPVNPATAEGKAKNLLEAVKAQFGVYPTMFKIAAQSPAGLEGMLGMFGALGGGTLSGKLREQIALTVSEHNTCDWCLSAHTAIGRKQGLTAAEADSARDAVSADPKAQAALTLVHQILSTRGKVSDTDLEAVRAAGYTDGEVVEIVGNVALTTFTNYLNNVAETFNDFPAVKPRATATV